MNEALIKAAVRACVTLSSAIEATIEAMSHESGNAPEIVRELRSDLVDAYNVLTSQLSIDLKLDARKLIQDVIAAELESARVPPSRQRGERNATYLTQFQHCAHSSRARSQYSFKDVHAAM